MIAVPGPPQSLSSPLSNGPWYDSLLIGVDGASDAASSSASRTVNFPRSFVSATDAACAANAFLRRREYVRTFSCVGFGFATGSATPNGSNGALSSPRRERASREARHCFLARDAVTRGRDAATVALCRSRARTRARVRVRFTPSTRYARERGDVRMRLRANACVRAAPMPGNARARVAFHLSSSPPAMRAHQMSCDAFRGFERGLKARFL